MNKSKQLNEMFTKKKWKGINECLPSSTTGAESFATSFGRVYK